MKMFIFTAFVFATAATLSACELAVKLDLALVDAGEAPCTVCLDDADTVITDDAGELEIVSKASLADAAAGDAAAADASNATDASK